MDFSQTTRVAAEAQNIRMRQSGFTLVEVVMGGAALGIVIVTLYTMMAGGFRIVQNNRDNLRATQILINRMEGLRLFNWDQLVHSNMVPTTFTETYGPSGGTNSTGTIYYGTMTISNTSLATSYSSQMKMVTVHLNWTNGSLSHSRSMSTFVSQYGVQNYIYSN